ncbi:MAG: peptide chain release factor N(5)-glutamine methyltransferase [Bacteroidales bacterium]|nr:peptide chain release factor N(5)-glutamine methyltransferase [Bacteroidales bacterium]
MILREIRRSYREELNALYAETEADALFYWAAEEILNKKRVDAVACLPLACGRHEEERFLSVLARLKTAEPIQYIFQKAFFDGLELEVNPSVLIPRGETEELVQWAKEYLKEKENPLVLDLCTGSGAIAIALSAAFPSACVHACDISSQALRTAGENARRCGVEVDFFCWDVLSPALPPALSDKAVFDLVIANPPYVLPAERERMRPNVLDYEPSLALFVPEDDPLLFYRRIAAIAIGSLKPEGWLLAEINEALSERNEALWGACGFKGVEIRRDIHGKPRMIRGIKP